MAKKRKVSTTVKADVAEVLANVMGADYAQAYLGGVSYDEVRAERDRIRAEQAVQRRKDSAARYRRRAKQRAGVSRPAAPRVDREKVLGLYAEGLGVVEISRRVGAHRSTISKILRDEAVAGYTPGVVRDTRRQKTCQRGHDMSVHGKPNTGKKGGRYCAECRRMRERVSWKKQAA